MTRRALPISLMVFLAACGDSASTGSGSATPSTSGSAKPTASTKASATSSAKPAVFSGASASAAASTAPSTGASTAPSASASASAGGAPRSLDALFDGPPDAAIALGKPTVFGKASLGTPTGWKTGANWDSVDTLQRADGAATIVVLRLDVSEGLLDANVATWTKVPFSTDEVKWEPRVPGKFGAAHLEAKIAHGAGSIGKDEAEFWQAAVAGPDKKYPLVVIAGVKKAADASARNELYAALRATEWK